MKLNINRWKILLERLSWIDTNIVNNLLRFDELGIEFSDPELKIHLKQGQSSGEIRCVVGLVGFNDTISLNDIRASAGKIPLFLYPNSETDLKRIAEELKDSIDSLIFGSYEDRRKIFTESSEFRDALSLDAMYRHVTMPLKEKADIAWKARNYEKVIKIYEEILDKLTDSELRKYRYAQKIIHKNR